MKHEMRTGGFLELDENKHAHRHTHTHQDKVLHKQQNLKHKKSAKNKKMTSYLFGSLCITIDLTTYICGTLHSHLKCGSRQDRILKKYQQLKNKTKPSGT